MRIFILLNDDFNLVFAAVAGIRTNGIPALNNTVLDTCIVPNINIIKNHRVFNHTVVAYIDILKQNRILDGSVDDRSA